MWELANKILVYVIAPHGYMEELANGANVSMDVVVMVNVSV